jgi:hypothetical protein
VTVNRTDARLAMGVLRPVGFLYSGEDGLFDWPIWQIGKRRFRSHQLEAAAIRSNGPGLPITVLPELLNHSED